MISKIIANVQVLLYYKCAKDLLKICHVEGTIAPLVINLSAMGPKFTVYNYKLCNSITNVSSSNTRKHALSIQCPCFNFFPNEREFSVYSLEIRQNTQTLTGI